MQWAGEDMYLPVGVISVRNRVHGFTIDKRLQKGAMTGVVYKNAPQNVFHSWVEVYFEDK